MQADEPTFPAAAMSSAARDSRPLARRMLWRATLAQNVMTGFVFGAFGTFVIGIERDYQVDRATSALPIPCVLLALALLSPVVGSQLHRWSLRVVMMCGAVLISLGFAAMAMAGSMLQLMLAFGLLIGPGASLMGTMVPTVLVARWHHTGLGRALGVVNVPLLVGLAPLLSMALQEHMSYRGVAWMMAVATLAMVLVLWGVIDAPADVGLRPVGEENVPAVATQAAAPVLPYRELLRSPGLWATASVGVVLAVSSTTMVTHLLPMAVSWGYEPERAAWLLSALGLVGVIGSPLFGWMSDRLGPTGALTVNVALQALCWFAMTSRPEFGVMLPLCLLLGLGSSGMLGALGAALSKRFGVANFGRCYGVFSLINLPFVVSAPVIFGKVFSATGSYGPAFAGQLVAFGVAFCVGLTLCVVGRARPAG